MKKGWLTVIIVVLLAACANYNVNIHQNEASVYVSDQIFKKIKINDSFTYIGAFPFRSQSGLYGTRHSFVKSNTEAINIILFETERPFKEVNLTTNILDNGYFKNGLGSYYYYTMRVNDCVLAKTIQVPIEDKLKATVQYIEDLNSTGIECGKWSDPWKLNYKQKEYLSQFNTHSIDAIKIMD